MRLAGRDLNALQQALSSPHVEGRDTGRAMSQENVEIVKRATAAVNARDIAAYLACCTQDIELHTATVAITGVYEGPAGIRRF